MKRLRDSNRSKVYDAEALAWHGRSSGPMKLVSRVEGRTIVRAACDLFGVDRCKVAVRRGGVRGFYRYETKKIHLLPEGEDGRFFDLRVLLHELAHHIIAERYAEASPHGPEFVAVVASLYVLIGDRDPVRVMERMAEVM